MSSRNTSEAADLPVCLAYHTSQTDITTSIKSRQDSVGFKISIHCEAASSSS